MIAKIEIAGAIQTLAAIADSIHELGRIPAGHLYALLMTKMTYHQFEQAIALLVEANQIKREGDELIWKGGGS